MDARGWSTTGRLRGWHRVTVIIALCQLLVEAAGIVTGLCFLVWFQHRYRMVVSNIAPSTVAHAADIAGAVVIAFLVCCGVALVRGVTRHPLGGFAQTVLTIRLVVTTILVVASVALFGWLAFAALLVLLLAYVLAYAGMPTRAQEEEAAAAGFAGGAGEPDWFAARGAGRDDTAHLGGEAADTAGLPAQRYDGSAAEERPAIPGFDWPPFEWSAAEGAEARGTGPDETARQALPSESVAAERRAAEHGEHVPERRIPEQQAPGPHLPRHAGYDASLSEDAVARSENPPDAGGSAGGAPGRADDDPPPAG